MYNTSLMYAADNGYIDIVMIILSQNGIDINKKDIFQIHFMYYILI